MPSTVIADMIYNAGNATLRIRFLSGPVYEYQKVPPKIFTAMQRARSKGKFLDQYIKGNYEYQKIS